MRESLGLFASGWAHGVTLPGLYVLLCPRAPAQQQTLGSIVGHVSVARGDAPPERIMVTLEVRGAPMDSVYADSSGTFGFHNLGPNPYYVVVNDEDYEPVRRETVIDPNFQAPTVYLELTLVPRKKLHLTSRLPRAAQSGHY